MNIIYTTENDRNGKARYYRVTDGKKKVCSKAEYEAHVCETKDEIETVGVSSNESDERNGQMAFEEMAIKAEPENEVNAKDVRSDKEIDVTVSADLAFDLVKDIVKSTGSKHHEKMYLQKCKKCAAVNYRNCTVCSLIYNKHGGVSAVKFMGTTAETRKRISVYNIDCLGDLSEYQKEIISQIEYIDRCYESTFQKSCKAS